MSDLNNNFIMPARLTVCLIFAVLFLSGCMLEPMKKNKQWEVRTQSNRQPPPVKPAQVTTYGLKDDQNGQRLLRADTLIQTGDTQEAAHQLDLINEAELSLEQRGKFNLLSAQILLSMGSAEQALQKLNNARPTLLSTDDKINYYQSLAFAKLLMGEVLQGVSARIKLGNLLKSPQQQHANISAIIDMLSVLPENPYNVGPETANELKGWTELAKILKKRSQPALNIDAELQQWQQQFPDHAANAAFLQAYLANPPSQAQSDGSTQEPATITQTGAGLIAVFLPTSGSYAPAGNAIKEGIQVAYRLAASATQQLPLKFYDSAQGDIASVYQQAVNEGASWVIGPLVKDQIQALSLSAELTVPVLALNHIEGLVRDNLYQFGLSPIDEAEALALKAHQDGRKSAMILVPNSQQGQRIGQYLTSAWQNSGGIVTGIQTYEPRQHDISAVFNQLISNQTYPGAQQPSRAVLLSANEEAARELAPQLKYQQAIDLAVYAMPTIYAGHPNPTKDAELGLFGFCDIPWLFDGFYSGPLSQAALQDSWQNLPDSVIRLLALGIDAYNLLTQLHQLSNIPYSGATGRLSLNSENRITRKLVCAQFKGGVPVASGYPE